MLGRVGSSILSATVIFQMNRSEVVSLSTVSAIVGVSAALLLGIAIFIAQVRLAGMIFYLTKTNKTTTKNSKTKNTKTKKTKACVGCFSPWDCNFNL